MTLRDRWDHWAIRNIIKIRSIYPQLGISTVFIVLILSLQYPSANNLCSLCTAAQSSITTNQDEQNPEEAIQTFQIDGTIGSLITDLLNPALRQNVSESPPLYVLVGNWSMGVLNGETSYLQIDFIMALEDGTQAQVYSIENLRNIVIAPSSPPSEGVTSSPIDQELSSNNLVLSPTNNYSLSLFGYVDLLSDDNIIWGNVPISIDIFNGNTISILLYPSETDNRFKGQPIYGIVTLIVDANNNPVRPSLWAVT